MATLTRSNSRPMPLMYKDYVNFLESYKNGKKEDENSDSGISGKSFPLSNNTSSSSLSSSDVTDFSKNTCTPYNTFLENSKNKKFGSVKPNLERNDSVKSATKKSEIFIEIQPPKSVSEVSKMFEQKPPPKSNKINSKISIFEKQTSVEGKPKLAEKPVLKSPPPKIEVQKEVTFSPQGAVSIEENEVVLPPPPPPMPTAAPITKPVTTNTRPSPPPSQPPKLQATLTKGPQTRYSVSTPNGLPTEIDRNNPLVKKLVYGTLRGMYGAYHDKANDMLATMPRNMVVRSNGVQDRIEQIAANGDLDKLNGRVNPKLEQE